MPIDMQNETIFGLNQAAKVLPRIDGRRAHPSTLWRWCRRGVGGVTLEYVRVGRRICTSREALNRFCNALAAADEPPGSAASSEMGPPAPTYRGRTAASFAADQARAEEVLNRAGI